MANLVDYHYTMGFEINGTPIPDPSKFSGSDSDLDSSATRDANGNLRRKKVAAKTPTKMEYNCLDWSMMQTIMQLMGEKFQFTYPDPRYGIHTITAYAGDREWEALRCPSGAGWLGSLKFSVIEY